MTMLEQENPRRCPICGSLDFKVYRTKDRIQYRQCQQPACGHTGKTILPEKARKIAPDRTCRQTPS